MCEECGVKIQPMKDGVCPVCKKQLCYACWEKHHRNACYDARGDDGGLLSTERSFL